MVECGRVLRCLYVSENVCTLDTSLTVRPVQSVHVTRSGSVYYGDNGHNLKLLDWKNNRVSKFSNHTTDQATSLKQSISFILTVCNDFRGRLEEYCIYAAIF